MAFTPSCFNAAMFALDGIVEGEWTCPTPCLARNARCVPEGSRAIVIGELAKPHGFKRIR